ncbi:helix-turn-helix domain-containing protein [Bradyrhizobium sp. GCM10027634]|uniref:helix-turn-helix domain-containing protein n=1 Tax=unclassified Bradyrhizobium TaxID=2631580 RepID=UPI00188D628E|nr:MULTISPECIES: helix-turn-helix domain-containing protein [unclassified Bradyrhizobium]MDN5002027.1 helix-turn-helix domain-containing protein [Bradyrhizobium sp. WYCCWR 12677]QOZ45699.1 AraC family transcriptional regulator [Bradyrhizobium sp. CCBAU 53340]
MGPLILVDSRKLDGFEGLRGAVHGSHVDVMQLGRGRLRGRLSHVGIGDFSLSIGTFNVGMRTQRVSSDDKLIIGMLLAAEERVAHWAFDMQLNDVLVIPPLLEHDGVFHGASAYAAMRFDLGEVATLFSGEGRLSDPDAWRSRGHFRADPKTGAIATRRLVRIMSHLRARSASLTPATADFWKRSIVECMAANIMSSLPPDDSGWLPSARRLIRRVEDYLDATGTRPVHVAEICAALGVSRRTLHRAFQEVFGLGPVSFLRHKRLCAVHSILRRSAPGSTTVAAVAMEQGFYELGRFAQYYLAMFGEHPSQTLGGATLQTAEDDRARA